MPRLPSTFPGLIQHRPAIDHAQPSGEPTFASAHGRERCSRRPRGRVRVPDPDRRSRTPLVLRVLGRAQLDRPCRRSEARRDPDGFSPLKVFRKVDLALRRLSPTIAGDLAAAAGSSRRRAAPAAARSSWRMPIACTAGRHFRMLPWPKSAGIMASRSCRSHRATRAHSRA